MGSGQEDHKGPQPGPPQATHSSRRRNHPPIQNEDEISLLADHQTRGPILPPPQISVVHSLGTLQVQPAFGGVDQGPQLDQTQARTQRGLHAAADGRTKAAARFHHGGSIKEEGLPLLTQHYQEDYQNSGQVEGSLPVQEVQGADRAS